jgi:hypothetical protein
VGPSGAKSRGSSAVGSSLMAGVCHRGAAAGGGRAAGGGGGGGAAAAAGELESSDGGSGHQWVLLLSMHVRPQVSIPTKLLECQ